ncbi:DUF3471 domain-containing protein [Luteibacter rhizovicinus]|nr:DUF3471 domain-containing protein [Luteibacter rhizovicinus]
MRQEEAEARQAVATSTKASHPGQGPSLPMAGYVGVYKDPWYGTITIGKTGNALSIRFDRSPGLDGALEHVQHDTFRTRFSTPGYEDAYVTFALKPDGRVDRISMKAVSPVADFSWDYQDLQFTPAGEP